MKMEIQARKKKRAENWTMDDKELLKSLVAENVSIVENKCVNTNTNKAKKDCWDLILTLFNAASNTQRGVSQLQFQWRAMKLKVKRNESNYRRELLATGGGPAPKPPDKECSEIMDLIPNEFKIDCNTFDSDGRAQQNSKGNAESITNDEFEDEQYLDTLGLVTPCIINKTTTTTASVPRRKLLKAKKNKNYELKFKEEIFELTKKHMAEEHQQRMENLWLEKECRLMELKKLDAEFEMLSKNH